MPSQAMSIMAVSEVLMMMFWPTLSAARLTCVCQKKTPNQHEKQITDNPNVTCVL
jgi:hypothetical protein